MPILIFPVNRVWTVPEKAIFRSVTVYKKNYPVNAICLLKQNKCRIHIYILRYLRHQRMPLYKCCLFNSCAWIVYGYLTCLVSTYLQEFLHDRWPLIPLIFSPYRCPTINNTAYINANFKFNLRTEVNECLLLEECNW